MPEQDNNSNSSNPESVLGETERKMDSSITALKRELSAIRTGRATPALIENVPVDYYGVSTPLNQIASISTPDARAIMVQPWDKQALQEIEKSLIKSDMGFNPSNDGTIITVPIPPLTQERRQELVRLLKRKLEEGKVSIRNVRRDGIDSLRKLERAKSISQDENRRTQEQLQKSTDNHVKIADELGASKETEIMQV